MGAEVDENMEPASLVLHPGPATPNPDDDELLGCWASTLSPSGTALRVCRTRNVEGTEVYEELNFPFGDWDELMWEVSKNLVHYSLRYGAPASTLWAYSEFPYLPREGTAVGTPVTSDVATEWLSFVGEIAGGSGDIVYASVWLEGSRYVLYLRRGDVATFTYHMRVNKALTPEQAQRHVELCKKVLSGE